MEDWGVCGKERNLCHSICYAPVATLHSTVAKEELNHAAHAAKQDGLGIDDPEQAVQKKDEDQDWLR